MEYANIPGSSVEGKAVVSAASFRETVKALEEMVEPGETFWWRKGRMVSPEIRNHFHSYAA